MSVIIVQLLVSGKKILKVKPSLIFKRYFKSFEMQAFVHHFYLSDLSRVSLIPDVELEWEYFKTIFLSISNKHVPMKKLRISVRDNPWFSHSLSELINLRSKFWAQARMSDSSVDWIMFRTLRNKCTFMIRDQSFI